MGDSIFTPGNRPGPYAAGMDLASDANALVDKQLRMARVPRGSGVSAEFPWWRTLTETLGINARVYLRRPNWSASGFANASDKRVRITEIRMRGDLRRWSENSGLREGLWVRMGTANGQQVVQEWQPWQALQTEMDRFALAELDSYAVKFPAEYFLSRSNLFRLDVRYDADIFDINQFTAGTNEYIVMAGLHGWAPVDGRPFDLMLPIIMWQRDNPAAGDFESWSFDDARERPLRDAWITHFSIGAAKQSNDDRALQGLQFRLHAPDGPKWHEDEWYRIDMLAEQIGSLRAMDDFVIHRPKVPYIIEPGQSFDIEVWNRTGAAVGFEATVQGLQEV